MKTLFKILTIALLVFLSFGINTQFSNADDEAVTSSIRQDGGAGANTPKATGGKIIKVVVTEPIPGVKCKAETEEVGTADGTYDQETGSGRYECEVPVGWTAFLAVLGRMIRFMTGAAMLCAVLFLVFNGIRLSMSGLAQVDKTTIKTQILGTIGGIILLLLSGPILKIIAPWVYT